MFSWSASTRPFRRRSASSVSMKVLAAAMILAAALLLPGASSSISSSPDRKGGGESTGGAGTIAALVVIWPKGSKQAEAITKIIRKQKKASGMAMRGMYHFAMSSRAATPLQQLSRHTKKCGMGKAVVILVEGRDMSGLAGELNGKSCVSFMTDARHLATATGIDAVEFQEAVGALPSFSGSVSTPEDVTHLGSYLLIQGATSMMKAGNFQSALGSLRRVTELEPNNGAVHSSIGIALASMGDRNGAMESLREAVRLTPKDPDLRSRLALLLDEEYLLSDAAAEYKEAMMLDPKDPRHLASYSHVQRKLGLSSDSEEGFNSTLRMLAAGGMKRGQLEDLQTQASVFHGMGLLLADRGEVSEGISYIRRALAVSSFFPAALSDLGRLLLSRGDVEAAADALSQALSMLGGGRRSWPTHALLLLANRTLGRYEKIESSYAALAERIKNTTSSEGVSPVVDTKLGRSLPISADMDRLVAAMISRSTVLSLGGGKHTLAPTPVVGSISSLSPLRVAYYGASAISDDGIGRHIAGLLAEHHSQGRVAASAVVIGKAEGRNAESLRARGQLVEMSGLSALEVAQSLNGVGDGNGYHVVISVDSWSMSPAMRALALSPAPLQVSWLLGAAGTTGASFMHGFMTDSVASPPELAALYSERLIVMPLPSALLAGHFSSCPPVASNAAEAGGMSKLGFLDVVPPTPAEIAGLVDVTKRSGAGIVTARYSKGAEQSIATSWKSSKGKAQSISALNFSSGGCIPDGISIMMHGSEPRYGAVDTALAGLVSGVPTVTHSDSERAWDRASSAIPALAPLFVSRGFRDSVEVASRLVASANGRSAVAHASRDMRLEADACGRSECRNAALGYSSYARAAEVALQLAFDAADSAPHHMGVGGTVAFRQR